MTSLSISSAWINEVLDVLERQGLSRSRLIEGIYGLEDGRASDGSLVEVIAVRRVWWRAARLSADRLLGLRVGLALSPRATNVLAVIRWHSRTFAESLDRLMRYQQLMSESGRFVASHAPGDIFHLAYRPRPAAIAIHPLQVDSVIAAMIREGPSPLAIDLLARGDPQFGPAASDLLGCDVDSDGAKAAIRYRATDLDRVTVGADPGLCAVNIAYAEELLRNKRRHVSLCASVGEVLNRMGYSAGLRHVAGEIGLSPRTLQRRLTGAGISFKQLAQAQRMDRALLLLSETKSSVDTIAQLLEYSDASAFSRAVSNWWGESPRALRRLNGTLDLRA